MCWRIALRSRAKIEEDFYRLCVCKQILVMKTEELVPQAQNVDPIWSTNVELLPSEECLPVIGGCQVSSILQNLEPTPTDSNLQSVDLIILHGNEIDGPLDLHTNNYIVIKDPTGGNFAKNIESISTNLSPKHYDKESFEDMLYFVCNLCPFLCTKQRRITDHLETVHKNKTVSNLVKLKCPACPNIFYHRASLKSHLMHDHCVANTDLNLIVQAVMFYSNNKADLKENESPQKNDSKPAEVVEKVALPQVDTTAANSEKLISNLMKKDPVVKYINSKKCSYASCKVLLSDPKNMDYHIESHQEERFKCLECQEQFPLWKPLTSHLWRIHKIDLELFSCDKCDYKTHSLSKLTTCHIPTHSTAKTVQCDTCQKYFKNQKQMRNHRRIHRDITEKEHCELCAKTFKEKRQLRYHMDSVHRKLKPFLCNYCGYKGSNRNSLKIHLRSHTGEKPFLCDQCSYSSTDHNSLRRHKLRHSGQKPYKCSYCPYACIQSSSYKVHLKTKHPGMENGLMFACFMCQFRTVNKDMYTTHLTMVHNKEPTTSPPI